MGEFALELLAQARLLLSSEYSNLGWKLSASGEVESRT